MAALTGFPAAAMAGQAAASDDEEEELEEVQVTGTRIISPNTTATNPITSITAEEMARLGIVNVADALTVLVPQNISTYQPSLVGDDQAGFGGGGMEGVDRGSYFIGNTIANLRGMDPAFGSRTLTLVNGRRVVSTSNQADVVDLNIIPSNLLERMDVVTGGASATYGSGAMAGVVNLVLNNRLQGINLDMDYNINEAGDGGSPHIALSAGTRLLDGRAHMLVGAEWRKQNPILNCAEARKWCEEARYMFGNSSGGASALDARLVPQVGFEDYPARFQMGNVRYSQFAPTGTLLRDDVSITSNYRFDEFGTEMSEYALGYRGGGSTSNVMNGDGPLMTSASTLRPDTESGSLFTNFEYDLTPTTTASLQLTYGKTDNMNRNRYTQGSYCTRFDANVATAQRGTNAAAGQSLGFGIAAAGIRLDTGGSYGGFFNPRSTAHFPTNTNNQMSVAFAKFIGMLPENSTATTGGSFSFASGNGFENAAQVLAGTPGTPRRGVSFPFYMPVELSPSPPQFDFNNNAIGEWVKVRLNDWQPSNPNYTAEFPTAEFWVLDKITLTVGFDQGTATVLPELGPNAYAFLNNLSEDALYQVANAFGNMPAAIGSTQNAISGGLYGDNPCNGSTGIRKVWNPQLQQYTESSTERWSVQGGIKGRFGSDWRWDLSAYYGTNESTSRQHNVATNLRLAFAMDAVVDTRVDSLGNPVNPETFGTPICRVVRDGSPVLDVQGRPLSNPESLAALAASCKPINIFGNVYSDSAYFEDPEGNQYTVNGVPVFYNARDLQQQAIDYSFVEARSAGRTTRSNISFTTSGTLWGGWGAGPMRGAFTLDLSQDTNNNAGTKGDAYLRADLTNSWQDAFGGKTRQLEPSMEVNMPIVSGVEGMELLSLGATYRYGLYNVKGGAGTTGQSATQKTPSWRISAEYAPFDWMRFRTTRSRDMRAGGYRELFIYQPGQPDQFSVTNPWRTRTATSISNQQERFGQIRVGNPDLKPERSDTLTLGFVLSPGGWAQGMRMSIDYSSIRIKDGITVPFNANRPVDSCFTQSGGVAPEFDADGQIANPGDQTAFDENNRYCQQLRFAELLDEQGNPIPGSRNLQELVSYTSATPQNALPYQNRSVDISLGYNFPLSRAFESLPGSLSLNLRGTRLLEASGIQHTTTLLGGALNTDPCGAKYELADPQNYTLDGVFRLSNRYNCVNLVGQIRSSTFIPGVQAAPTWRGNFSASYLMGDLTTTLSAQYVGAAKLDLQWTDDPTDPRYYTAEGYLTNATVDDNSVDPYLNFALNASYNLDVGNLKQFQIWGSVNNLFDKDPPFAGGGVGGAAAGYADTLGRSYRMGVRLKF
ncbi:MAG TPA: TonB-dependent receptor [Steroidobacteraceae bacterium]|nr:TonB-dependent receptor [Steroidobacteraceae bacterium]